MFKGNQEDFDAKLLFLNSKLIGVGQPATNNDLDERLGHMID